MFTGSDEKSLFVMIILRCDLLLAFIFLSTHVGSSSSEGSVERTLYGYLTKVKGEGSLFFWVFNQIEMELYVSLMAP